MPPETPATGAETKPPPPMTPQQRLDKLRAEFPTVPTLFKGQYVEVPFEQAVESMQKGMKVTDLDKQKKALATDQQAFAAYERMAKQWGPRNPEAFKLIIDMVEGHVDANDVLARLNGERPARTARGTNTRRRDDDDRDDDDLDGDREPRHASPDPASAATLRRLEATIEELRGQVGETRNAAGKAAYEARRDAALGQHPFMKIASTDEIQLARELIDANVMSGEFSTPEQAVPSVVTRLHRIAEGRLEAERAARERAKEAETAKPNAGLPAARKLEAQMPKRERGSVLRHVRSGVAAKAIVDAFKAARGQAVNGS